eukprot:GHVT01010695.1.p1 GENE.GHVT01010695.1~~GHVT01010695.1.p1  ORF type:complete len:679 (+),score=126.03 GHVT01010695.1:4880-6916(+)
MPQGQSDAAEPHGSSPARRVPARAGGPRSNERRDEDTVDKSREARFASNGRSGAGGSSNARRPTPTTAGSPTGHNLHGEAAGAVTPPGLSPLRPPGGRASGAKRDDWEFGYSPKRIEVTPPDARNDDTPTYRGATSRSCAYLDAPAGGTATVRSESGVASLGLRLDDRTTPSSRRAATGARSNVRSARGGWRGTSRGAAGEALDDAGRVLPPYAGAVSPSTPLGEGRRSPQGYGPDEVAAYMSATGGTRQPAELPAGEEPRLALSRAFYEEVDALLSYARVDPADPNFCLPPPIETLPLVPHQKTTVMIKNLPARYGQPQLLANLRRKGFGGKFAFLYLPMNFKEKTNAGYAFISFLHPYFAMQCRATYNGRDVEEAGGIQSAQLCDPEVLSREGESVRALAGRGPSSSPRNRLCEVKWAKLQGLRENMTYYQNAAVLTGSTASFKPALFRFGVAVPWPSPSDGTGVPVMAAVRLMGRKREGITLEAQKRTDGTGRREPGSGRSGTLAERGSVGVEQMELHHGMQAAGYPVPAGMFGSQMTVSRGLGDPSTAPFYPTSHAGYDPRMFESDVAVSAYSRAYDFMRPQGYGQAPPPPGVMHGEQPPHPLLQMLKKQPAQCQQPQLLRHEPPAHFFQQAARPQIQRGLQSAQPQHNTPYYPLTLWPEEDNRKQHHLAPSHW